MDWITGILTLIAMEMLGRKMWQGWAVGLFNQLFWITLIIQKELWGLLPLTAVLIWRYTNHLIVWRKV